MSTKIEFTETMNEISGFGGFYERCCRAGVVAGAKWLRAHPNAKPEYLGYDGVYGIVIADNDAAMALDLEIMKTEVARDDGTKSRLSHELTGNQHHAIAHHLVFVAEKGWDAYRERMSAPVAVYTEDEK
jgi:hypothetical protein